MWSSDKKAVWLACVDAVKTIGSNTEGKALLFTVLGFFAGVGSTLLVVLGKKKSSE